ncbi:MAG: SprT family zinc-dependent metalloprotease [Candidatus Cloacimonadaceae bacterium]
MIMLDNDKILIIRSDRISVRFKTLADGRLEVRMPLAMTTQELHDLMVKKQDVLDRLVLRHNERSAGREYKEGAQIVLFGEALEISFVEKPGFCWKYDNKLYIDKYFERNVPAVLKDFYEKQAPGMMGRAKQIQREFGFHEVKIGCRWMKSRWGSYSSKGNMTLNIALVMAPRSIIDYVIIHELCHQRHPNHSPQFWQEVERYLPTYRSFKAWLKEHGHLLRIMPQVL